MPLIINNGKDAKVGALEALIVPVIVVIVVALIIIWATERFSPDPLVTKIVHVIVFACVLIFLVTKLLPLLMTGAHAEGHHHGDPHWGGAEFSGRGMQNHHWRHEHEGFEGRIHNNRWYGPEWCWTDNGIPFRCEE